jgi:methoxymalonate biosynthesis acyl carrier protein
MRTNLRDDQVTWDLLDFLATSLGQPVAVDDDFFALGMANSLFALELINFLEERYGLAVEVEDLELDNFRTAARIAAFIMRKTA